MKRRISILTFSLLISAASAQVDPELLRKAREAGITPEQIDAIFQTAPRETSSEPADPGEPIRRRPEKKEGGTERETDEKPDSLPPKPAVFGQDLFQNPALTFTPDFHLATPKDYVLGPGDEVVIEVWGAAEASFRGDISPEGTLSLAGVGPVSLGGATVEEAAGIVRSRLRGVIAGIGSGSQLRVSLGKIRSVNVHIVGDVGAPGTYTLPSLATVLNALYLAGGPSGIGSLRTIRLMRRGGEVARTDLYETLIDGRTEGNIRLEEGDVILVPPYHARVHASGEVKRPLGYELREGETMADLLRFAGDFSHAAYRNNVTLHRRSGRQHQLYTVEAEQFGTFVLQDGDSVAVGRILDRYANRVTIRGALWRPGEYELSDSMNRLSQLIVRAENLRGDAFSDRGQIVRQRADFTTEVVSFSVRAIVSGEADIVLYPEDEIVIPSIEEMTEKYYVLVRGEVNRPDTLPFRYRMTVDDALVGAGGVKESAAGSHIEVARRENGTVFDANRTLALRPFDEVYVRRAPGYAVQQRAAVSGEISYAGDYALARAGERLSELIARAGGLAPGAYAPGASLTRRLNDDERARLEARLAVEAAKLGRDSVSVEDLDFPDTYAVGIDLERALRDPGGAHDPMLRDGDAIHIPRPDNTVRISGAVMRANAVTFDGRRLRDYLSQGGGYTDEARRRPFVVYMNGEIAATRSGFLHRRYPRIEPGCEIVVPERSPNSRRVGVLDIVNIAASTTTLAAMIATMIK